MSWAFALYAIDLGSKEESMEKFDYSFLKILTLATEYKMQEFRGLQAA